MILRQIKVKKDTYEDLLSLRTSKTDTVDSLVRKCIEARKRELAAAAAATHHQDEE
ncbi:MAG: hypothetical protein ACRD8Z_23920 [Nitrososphaeraceae archaeon]